MITTLNRFHLQAKLQQQCWTLLGEGKRLSFTVFPSAFAGEEGAQS